MLVYPFKRTFNLLSPCLFHIWNIYTHNTSTLPMSSTQNNLFSCFTKAVLTIDSTCREHEEGHYVFSCSFLHQKGKRTQNKISQTQIDRCCFSIKLSACAIELDTCTMQYHLCETVRPNIENRLQEDIHYSILWFSDF